MTDIPSSESPLSSASTVVRHTTITRTTDPSSTCEVINHKYVLDKKSLGSGSYSDVQLSHALGSSPPQYFAMKKISKSRLRKIKEYGLGPLGRPKVSTALDKIYKEILIQQQMKHWNIVRLHEVFDDANDDTLMLVLDYCDCGAVMDFCDEERRFQMTPQMENHPVIKHVGVGKKNTMGGFGEKFCKYLFSQLISAVEYIHSIGVAHRDIKPDNILLAVEGKDKEENKASKEDSVLKRYPEFHGCVLKLCDFSVSRQFGPSESGNVLDTQGTYHFYAPEMCVGEEYSAYKADVYMMGQTLYCWATTRVPYWSDAGNPQELFDMIAENPLTWPEGHGLSEEFVGFVSSIMCKDPKKRMGFEEMRSHQWMTNDSK